MKRQYKRKNKNMEGDGIIDYFKEKGSKAIQSIKKTFSPRLNDYPRQTKDILLKYGNIPIKSLTIYRTPISGILEGALNLISFGKFSELKRKYGFDKLFHLAIIANVGNKNLVIEKNEVINVSTTYKTSKDTETLNVPLNGKVFTVNEMLEKTRERIGDKLFFDYHYLTNNCQFFIRYLLENMGLYNNEINRFVFQDLGEIYKQLPGYVSKIAKGITTTGAIFQKLTGNGEEEKKINVKNMKGYGKKARIKKDAKLTRELLEGGITLEGPERDNPSLIKSLLDKILKSIKSNISALLGVLVGKVMRGWDKSPTLGTLDGFIYEAITSLLPAPFFDVYKFFYPELGDVIYAVMYKIILSGTEAEFGAEKYGILLKVAGEAYDALPLTVKEKAKEYIGDTLKSVLPEKLPFVGETKKLFPKKEKIPEGPTKAERLREQRRQKKKDKITDMYKRELEKETAESYRRGAEKYLKKPTYEEEDDDEFGFTF